MDSQIGSSIFEQFLCAFSKCVTIFCGRVGDRGCCLGTWTRNICTYIVQRVDSLWRWNKRLVPGNPFLVLFLDLCQAVRILVLFLVCDLSITQAPSVNISHVIVSARDFGAFPFVLLCVQ